MEELLEKYFENTLTDEEQESLKEKLATDASFREEFEFHKSLRQGIHFKERNELKSMLNEIDRRSEEVRFEVHKNSSFWKYAAAVAILVMAGVGIYSYQNEGNTNEELYVAYYQTYPNVVAPNVRGKNVEGIKNDAFKAYEAEDYPEAVRLFEQLGREEFAVFYTAVSCLEINENQRAIELLNSREFNESPYPFQTYSKWYLALAYLKTDKKDAAKMILKELAATENPQQTKASELLARL